MKKNALITTLLVALGVLIGAGGQLLKQTKHQVYLDAWLTNINSHRMEKGVFQNKIEPGSSFKLNSGDQVKMLDLRLIKVEFNREMFQLNVYVWGDFVSQNFVKPIQFSDIKSADQENVCNAISLFILDSPVVINGRLKQGAFFEKEIKKIAIYFTTPFPEEVGNFKEEGQIITL